MQPFQNCIGPTIRIGREILCLLYAGFLIIDFFQQQKIDCLAYVILSAHVKRFIVSYMPKVCM